jgi:hypothetical protein
MDFCWVKMNNPPFCWILACAYLRIIEVVCEDYGNREIIALSCPAFITFSFCKPKKDSDLQKQIVTEGITYGGDLHPAISLGVVKSLFNRNICNPWKIIVFISFAC